VRRWYLLLLVMVLAGCGQPMQIGAPSPVQMQPTRLPPDTALPTKIANNVPSATPSAQATALLRPTATAATAPSISAAATPPPAVIIVPLTQLPETNEARWRAQEQDRKVNDPPRIYVAPSQVTLWWYDPLNSQSVPIGTLSGEFPAQAEFILRSAQQAAFEVPYRINNDFGLTAISDAVRERMQAAGYTQSVEAYILRTADMHPK
jgi:hypothetical protein